jgi:hypothetical protein
MICGVRDTAICQEPKSGPKVRFRHLNGHGMLSRQRSTCLFRAKRNVGSSTHARLRKHALMTIARRCTNDACQSHAQENQPPHCPNDL